MILTWGNTGDEDDDGISDKDNDSISDKPG